MMVMMMMMVMMIIIMLLTTVVLIIIMLMMIWILMMMTMMIVNDMANKNIYFSYHTLDSGSIFCGGMVNGVNVIFNFLTYFFLVTARKHVVLIIDLVQWYDSP
jgi:hypothetical protein